MSKGHAVFVVGHEQWGKSTVLRQITSGVANCRLAQIGGNTFYVRKTSNDDWPNDERMWKWVKKVNSIEKPYLLLALCPDFQTTKKHTADILHVLEKTHTLGFFVLKYAYGSDFEITSDEIRELRGYGDVHIYSQRNQAARTVAAALRSYIESAI